jgi:hypothetical protein
VEKETRAFDRQVVDKSVITFDAEFDSLRTSVDETALAKLVEARDFLVGLNGYYGNRVILSRPDGLDVIPVKETDGQSLEVDVASHEVEVEVRKDGVYPRLSFDEYNVECEEISFKQLIGSVMP